MIGIRHNPVYWIVLGLLPMLMNLALCASVSNPIAWPQVGVVQQNALRSQRDLQKNISIDQMAYVAVSLRDVLFNKETNFENELTNTTTSLNGTDSLYAFSGILNQGTGGFILDIENRNNTWMVVDTPITLAAFLQTFEEFLDESNSNISADILFVSLRITLHTPNTFNNDNSVLIELMNSTTTNITNHSNETYTDENQSLNLTSILSDNLKSTYVYQPAELILDNIVNITSNSTTNLTVVPDNYSWPLLGNFLFEKRRRIVITELTDVLNYTNSPYVFPNTILHYDTNNSTISCPHTIEEFTDVASIKWRFLEAKFTYSEIQEYLTCGLSPIIKNSYNISSITDITSLLNRGLIWSWTHNQPRLSNSRLLMGKDSLQAINCAELRYESQNSSAYWLVADCYSAKNMLCLRNGSSFDWKISEIKYSYFDYYDDYKSGFCPDDYTFGIPITQLQEKSLTIYLENQEKPNMDIWINLNSISVSNCWVIGGRDAICPYARAVSRRDFVSMLVPVVVVVDVLLVCVLYLSLISVPIHDNRKNWRRVVNKISKSEMEGVPS